VSVCRIGPREYARLRAALHAAPGGPPGRFAAPGFAHELLVRPGTTDALVFESNLLREDYGAARLAFPVSFILDAGANVGYASAYLLRCYPSAHVLALEPDPENHALARRNLEPHGTRARLLRAGLWPCRARLRIVRGARADGLQVQEATEGEPYDCIGVDPLALLAEAGEERIHLFKCDIEGAEERLFGEDPDAWLERTDAIYIEIHGARAREVVTRAVGRHPFRHLSYRGIDFFVRHSLAVVYRGGA
jgi:FkbM family methyltransferase